MLLAKYLKVTLAPQAKIRSQRNFPFGKISMTTGTSFACAPQKSNADARRAAFGIAKSAFRPRKRGSVER